MTRMPPMRALVGVPPQSGKPGLRLAAALRTARGRGARSVRRTRRLRAGQCSAKSVWTAVLEGAAAGGNDLWRGGACGAVRCVWAAPGRPRAAPSPPSFTSPSRSRDRTRRALGKAEGKAAANTLRADSALPTAPVSALLQRHNYQYASTSSPPAPTAIFRPDSRRCTSRWALPPSGSTRSCRTCRRTRRCPARPDRSATTSSTGSRRSWGRRALAATASPLCGRLCAAAQRADS